MPSRPSSMTPITTSYKKVYFKVEDKEFPVLKATYLSTLKSSGPYCVPSGGTSGLPEREGLEQIVDVVVEVHASVSRADFIRFREVAFEGYRDISASHWISVLKLATLWCMDETKVVKELELSTRKSIRIACQIAVARTLPGSFRGWYAYGLVDLVNRKADEMPLLRDALEETKILGLETATKIHCLREEQLRVAIRRLLPPSTPPRTAQPLFFDSPATPDSRRPPTIYDCSSPREPVSSVWTLNVSDSVEERVRTLFSEEICALEYIGKQAGPAANMLHSRNWSRLRGSLEIQY